MSSRVASPSRRLAWWAPQDRATSRPPARPSDTPQPARLRVGAPISTENPHHHPPRRPHARRDVGGVGSPPERPLGACRRARSRRRLARRALRGARGSRARTAYRAKRLDEAYDLLTRIIALEPENGQWYERRAQVLVDLKRFRAAVDDFDAAVTKYEPEYRSLGLLSNRALAYEGLSDWNSAIRDYDEVIRLSGEIGRVPPYVLSSRGNAEIVRGGLRGRSGGLRRLRRRVSGDA